MKGVAERKHRLVAARDEAPTYERRDKKHKGRLVQVNLIPRRQLQPNRGSVVENRTGQFGSIDPTTLSPTPTDIPYLRLVLLDVVLVPRLPVVQPVLVGCSRLPGKIREDSGNGRCAVWRKPATCNQSSSTGEPWDTGVSEATRKTSLALALE